MNIRLAALALTIASLATAALAAEPNRFILVGSDGKPMGDATYTIDKTKDGYKVKSHFEYRIAAVTDDGVTSSSAPSGKRGNTITTAPGITTKAEFNADYTVDAKGNFITGFIKNSQGLKSFEPQKQRTAVDVHQMQGMNLVDQHTLNLPSADYGFAPDFDPAALEVFLNTAKANPRGESPYQLLVPGSSSIGPKAQSVVENVILLRVDDVMGTLDGKPITLRHYLMNYHDGHAELYTDETGNLMEADMGTLDAKYVRAKFGLTAQ
jgi:hypothetical protein